MTWNKHAHCQKTWRNNHHRVVSTLTSVQGELINRYVTLECENKKKYPSSKRTAIFKICIASSGIAALRGPPLGMPHMWWGPWISNLEPWTALQRTLERYRGARQIMLPFQRFFGYMEASTSIILYLRNRKIPSFSTALRQCIQGFRRRTRCTLRETAILGRATKRRESVGSVTRFGHTLGQRHTKRHKDLRSAV